jgi:1,4-alpha-glucan branching enzyme
MIVCIQNHDQIGNRPFGRRLNHQIEPALFRALSALLLFVPETPLLFMGQEWAASTRFLFFTDHHGELGELDQRTAGGVLTLRRLLRSGAANAYPRSAGVDDVRREPPAVERDRQLTPCRHP